MSLLRPSLEYLNEPLILLPFVYVPIYHKNSITYVPQHVWLLMF